MTETKNQSASLSDQKQTLRAQLFAITSQRRVLSTSTGAEEQAVVDALIQDVRDLVEGVEDVTSELGTLSATEKARRSRAERRLAEEICQRALSFRSSQCHYADSAADDDLHAITVEQKGDVRVAEQALARNICKLSQGLPLDSTGKDDVAALKTMLITYQPNQGIINIAIDTGTKAADCKCQTAQTRQRLTFAMQIEIICRMALDLLEAVDW